MIAVDTSALRAILQGEPEDEMFRLRITDAGGGVVSAASVVELGALMSGERLAHQTLMELLQFPFLEVEPVDLEQALIAAAAYRRFGKGHHPARLNLGDVFSYALAKHKNLPLLFKGGDFPQTDIEPALAM